MTNPSSESAAHATADVGHPISAADIVDRMTEQNKLRADDLRSYSEERHYTVTYHGFPMTMTASLVVKATYDAPTTKHFQIVSESGSRLLVDKVLKRLLQTEEDAARDPDKTALSPENYQFTLLDQETINNRRCYVLGVEPRVSSKLLYRGRVWVDATDYAVVKIEAEPAQNPSFWIRKTTIHHEYAKSGPFWLPERNRSETEVRLGGTAVLSIDYGTPKTQSEPTVTAGMR
jgi:hypothetical protein